MNPLTEDRNTSMRDGSVLSIPVKRGHMFYVGALIAINRNGFAIPGFGSSVIRGIGRCESQVDARTCESGDMVIAVRKGIFRYDNHDSDTITRGDIGRGCHIVDDHTVSRSNAAGTRSFAGKTFDVDSDGVWVKFD